MVIMSVVVVLMLIFSNDRDENNAPTASVFDVFKMRMMVSMVLPIVMKIKRAIHIYI